MLVILFLLSKTRFNLHFLYIILLASEVLCHILHGHCQWQMCWYDKFPKEYNLCLTLSLYLSMPLLLLQGFPQLPVLLHFLMARDYSVGSPNTSGPVASSWPSSVLTVQCPVRIIQDLCHTNCQIFWISPLLIDFSLIPFLTKLAFKQISVVSVIYVFLWIVVNVLYFQGHRFETSWNDFVSGRGDLEEWVWSLQSWLASQIGREDVSTCYNVVLWRVYCSKIFSPIHVFLKFELHFKSFGFYYTYLIFIFSTLNDS